jgi:hypothetical protein
LLLGAHEQHRLAVRDGLDQKVEGAPKGFHRVLQVDDVDAVAGAEDVRLHLRVPALGLVAEVNSRLHHVAHAQRRVDGRHRVLRLGS